MAILPYVFPKFCLNKYEIKICVYEKNNLVVYELENIKYIFRCRFFD